MTDGKQPAAPVTGVENSILGEAKEIAEREGELRCYNCNCMSPNLTQNRVHKTQSIFFLTTMHRIMEPGGALGVI